MDFYYYISFKPFADIFSENVIICRGISKKERMPTTGTVSSTHLFITDRKLKQELRGCGDDAGDFPVTIRLTIPDRIAKNLKVVLVDTESYAAVPGTLSEYDSTKHIGCFIEGQISITFISGILFENTENMKDIFLPSPDLWLPRGLFGVIDSEKEFGDEIDREKLQNAAESLESDITTVKKSISDFTKKRSMYYAAVDATKDWNCGRFILNVDPYIADIVGVSPEDIMVKIGEPIKWNPDVLTETADSIQKLAHEKIVALFRNTDKTTVFTGETIEEIKKSIISELNKDNSSENAAELGGDCIANFSRIGRFLYSDSSEGIDKVLSSLREYPPLLALFLTLKNPHDDNNFSSSLNVYNVDSVTSRLAWIYFSEINGMATISGDGMKSNMAVVRKIDEMCWSANLICTEDEYRQILGEKADKLIHKFEISCSKVLSFEDIHMFFTNSGKKFVGVASMQKEFGKTASDINWSLYLYYETTGIGVRFSDEDIKSLMKKGKCSTPFARKCINDTAFFNDHISPDTAFRKLYELKPEYWKNLYNKYNRS